MHGKGTCMAGGMRGRVGGMQGGGMHGRGHTWRGSSMAEEHA